MRDLSLVANDKELLAGFLSDQISGIRKRDDGVIEFNPEEYVSPFGNR